MAGKLTVRLENRLDEIQRIDTALDEFAKDQGVPETTLFQMKLAIEELFTNVISYAFEDENKHEIQIVVTVDSSEISVEIVDDGVAFDPTKQEQHLNDSLEDAVIGGHGIAIARSFTKELSYRRDENLNRLRLVKDLDR